MEEKPKHKEAGMDPFTYAKNEKKIEKENSYWFTYRKKFLFLAKKNYNRVGGSVQK